MMHSTVYRKISTSLLPYSSNGRVHRNAPMEHRRRLSGEGLVSSLVDDDGDDPKQIALLAHRHDDGLDDSTMHMAGPETLVYEKFRPPLLRLHR